MYGDGEQMMGSEDEDEEGMQQHQMMHDSYGNEGSPGNVSINSAFIKFIGGARRRCQY